MAFYALDSVQILTITAVLVPSLATIWVIFLQRDLNEKILVFKKVLKEYSKNNALELFNDIGKICKSSEHEDEEESLEVIMDFTEDWQLRSEAISELLGNEDKIYRMGKYILILLPSVFFSGLYSTVNPEQLILGIISKINFTQILFATEALLIFLWFLKIYNFAIMLNKVQSGEVEDIENLLDEIIKKMQT